MFLYNAIYCFFVAGYRDFLVCTKSGKLVFFGDFDELPVSLYLKRAKRFKVIDGSVISIQL